MQRVDIDDGAACRVDQDHPTLRRGERIGADQIARLRRERRVDADEVALAHQFGQRVGAPDADCELIAVRLVRVIEHHIHVESLGAAGRRRADATHPDDAEGAH